MVEVKFCNDANLTQEPWGSQEKKKPTEPELKETEDHSRDNTVTVKAWPLKDLDVEKKRNLQTEQQEIFWVRSMSKAEDGVKTMETRIERIQFQQGPDRKSNWSR